MLLLVCGTPEHEMISVSGAVLAVCSSSAKSASGDDDPLHPAQICALVQRSGIDFEMNAY
jgi:hypothetical protein